MRQPRAYAISVKGTAREVYCSASPRTPAVVWPHFTRAWLVAPVCSELLPRSQTAAEIAEAVRVIRQGADLASKIRTQF